MQSGRMSFIWVHEGEYMDARKFHDIWKAIHPQRAFGMLFGAIVDKTHYVQLKLTSCLRDPGFLAVMNRFKAECGDRFVMVGDIVQDGKNPVALALREARSRAWPGAGRLSAGWWDIVWRSLLCLKSARRIECGFWRTRLRPSVRRWRNERRIETS